MRRPSFRASFIALSVLFVALIGGHPAPAIAEPGGNCTALASPPTPQPQYEPILPLCTSARHQVVDISGSSPGGGTANPSYARLQDGAGTSLASVLAPGSNGTFALTIQGVSGGAAVPVSGTFWQATQPVSCASGATCPVNATLQAGSAIAGKFGIDQTTPGTTNGVQVNAALPAGANTIGAVTQASGPWTNNVTQFGSNNVATGTGASGVGIPRVTVSNDSNVLATQSGTWTVQPGNTPNTTPWLASINQGGTTANVFGSTAAGGISLSGINALSTLGAALYYNGSNLDIGRKDSYQAGPSWSTSGGASTTTVAAASAGPNVVKGSPGRLAKAVVTTVGTTGTDTFYDNASACSGTVLGTVQGTTAVVGNLIGTIVVFDMPAANGITECGGTGSAAVTVSYF